MALTPKPREALLAAFHAPGHSLTRCGGGFFDSSRHGNPHIAPVITRRTAITLIEMGLAEFNDPAVPSALTLNATGIAAATAMRTDFIDRMQKVLPATNSILVCEGYATATTLHAMCGMPTVALA